ncbi:putative membrane protein [Mariniflexile fucanivorans]|uniref:Protoporphyrinogen IX oxidase n=1 Tax=Mariniflexile fucanivorans TaxID=264023 RepID=A0A4V2QES6_9FLAO|nr:CopD family protein [Mariniflexile fucanivorans]TCL69147.1 putative membrane protein [Mariniflexile fucanivorans]
MAYFYIKAFHLIFVITWFAGLFYIPRLFVYQIEAFHKPSPDKEILGKQLKLMAKRLWYIITWPSAILALLFGLILFYMNPTLIYFDWMQVKLGFIVLLFIYHLKTQQYYKQLQNDIVKKTSSFMRIWNEGATFILFAVIFLVILKSAINWIWGIVGIFVLGVLIMLGFKLYKNIRDKNPEA